MKKVLLTIVLLLAGLTAGAQGKWTVTEQQADELTGQEAGRVYSFTSPGMGTLVVWDWNTPQFRIVGDEVFGVRFASGSSALRGLTIMVGIYDDAGALTDKFEMWLDAERQRNDQFIRTRDAGTMSNPMGQKKKVRKIFDALQSGKGYVRIVAPRYNRTDFDMKITPYIAE